MKAKATELNAYYVRQQQQYQPLKSPTVEERFRVFASVRDGAGEVVPRLFIALKPKTQRINVWHSHIYAL